MLLFRKVQSHFSDFVLVCALFLMCSGTTVAQTFTTSPSTPIPDVDLLGIDIPLVVSGLPTVDCSFGLDVICFDISHTWDSDLTISLVAPTGAVEELLSGLGGDQDDFTGTCLDMSSANNIDDTDYPFTGTFAPEAGNDFSTFNFSGGVDLNGTWYLRVVDGAGGDFGTVNSFSLTFSANPECSNVPPPPMPDACGFISDGTNDFCRTSTLIVPGGSFSGNTGNFTKDTENPSPLDQSLPDFSPSVENNGWYHFTATGTTESFFFSNVSGCTDGIQATVFEITYDANGCCVGFNSVLISPNALGWDPGSATTGTITAGGLVVGQQYMLMIDGFAGAGCDFTVSGWVESTLPVELLSFDVTKYDKENLVSWTTITEINNDYFDVERSFDAVNFEKIGTVAGAGNSLEQIDYSFSDRDLRGGITYYRLKQVDYDGSTGYSDIRAVSRKNTNAFAYPNPTSGELNVYLGDFKPTSLVLNIISSDGRIVEEQFGKIQGNFISSEKFSDLASGLYTIRVITDDGIELLLSKVTKQ